MFSMFRFVSFVVFGFCFRPCQFCFRTVVPQETSFPLEGSRITIHAMLESHSSCTRWLGESQFMCIQWLGEYQFICIHAVTIHLHSMAWRVSIRAGCTNRAETRSLLLFILWPAPGPVELRKPTNPYLDSRYLWCWYFWDCIGLWALGLANSQFIAATSNMEIAARMAAHAHPRRHE